ncbi:unnamed protein product [Fusarium venenatum]|uniref:GAG-pre-integrase domain-containing protein n=1 Tax=Fusarium venenatum TaxID=56646 RepID=A0A2L2TZT6_9HYPO|nr:uncharacterized protein FVRRES_08077 [Fusarium venenatum]CEI68000.1 unnamed protein product [Fusarium venenatum]
MDQNSLDSSRVILQGPGNWKLWINIIQQFATAYNIWELIKDLKLLRSAYIPEFHTSLVTLDLMLEKGYNWNPTTGFVFKRTTTLFYTRRIHRQQIIEFNDVELKRVQPAIQPALQPVETAATAFSSSSTPRPTQTAEADLWHQGLGHLNPAAREHLVEQTKGAWIKGPIRID